MHLILDQDPKSIVRIILITHGTPGSVWFAGDIVPGNDESRDDEENAHFELDLDLLRNYLINGLVYKNRTLQWTEVENRFADNAVFGFYCCNAGMSESFIQDVADFFDIRVQAFKHELKYSYPEHALTGGVIRRNLATVDGKHDFLDLVPEIDRTPSLKNPFK